MAKLYFVNLYKKTVDYDGILSVSLEGSIVVKRGLFTVKDIFERESYPIKNDCYGTVNDLDCSDYDMEDDDIFSELECFCGYDVENQDYEIYFVKKSDLNPKNELDENAIEQLFLKENPPKEVRKAFTKIQRRKWR